MTTKSNPSPDSNYPLPDLSLETATLHLRRAKYVITMLPNVLRSVAQSAVDFASDTKPRVPGTPELTECMERLKEYYNMAVFVFNVSRRHVEGQDRWESYSPFALFKAAGEAPPYPVDSIPYTYQALIRLAGLVLTIGWGETGVLRLANDPWSNETPAQRLSEPSKWCLSWGEPLPYFGDTKVADSFHAALSRESDRAERELSRILETSRSSITPDDTLEKEHSADQVCTTFDDLSPSRKTAWGQYDFALKASASTFGHRPTDKAVYDWLKNRAEDTELLPKFKTWVKYLRDCRKALGVQKTLTRRSRPAGKSVVSIGEV